MSPQRRFVIESVGLLLLSVTLTFFSVRNEWAAPLDQVLYDFYISRHEAPQHPDIVIVSIDDASLHEHGPWPWPRDLQAQLLRQVQQYQPALVAVDVIYAGATPDDLDLVAAAENIPWLALPMMIERLGAGRQHIEVLPFSQLLAQTDLSGHVHVELDDDALVRGTHLYQGIGSPHWPHLMLAVAEHVTGNSSPGCDADRQTARRDMHKCQYVRLPFAGPPGTYPQIPAQLLLSPDPSQVKLVDQAMRGKIVLLGLTATGVGDWVTSPTSSDGAHAGPMSGVEFNANLLSALVYNTVILSPSIWWALLLACAITAICSLLLPRLRPKQMLLLTVVLAGVPALLTLAGLAFWSIYLPLISASVAVLGIYPLWSWRRHEIAWSFIQEELDRIDDESRQWHSLNSWHSPHHTAAEAAQYLNQLLETDLDSSALTDDIDVLPDIQGPAATLLRDARTQLSTQLPPASLPGEILAKQIRTLQDRAREVREGRAIGLAGLDRMTNGVMIISALGEIRFINAAAARLLGTDTGTAAPQLLTLLNNIQPPLGQTWQDIMRAVVLANKPIAFESNAAAGTAIYVAAEPLAMIGSSAEPSMAATSQTEPAVADNNNYAPFWVLTLADLTAIRAAQAQREEALAFLSHDIRSPLLSVLALIRGSGQQSKLLDDISRYTQKGLSTSDQFLQLSRLQLQGEFERYDVELGQVIHNAVEQAFFLAKDKNITLRLGGLLDPAADSSELHSHGVWLTANGELLERAFDNLLSNAIKYSNSGSTITVELTVHGQQAVVQFADQGFGIPEDELARIFEPYFRSRVQELAENRGAGLGLRLVKTVVDRHHGSIKVASNRGASSGTVFTISLPLPEP